MHVDRDMHRLHPPLHPFWEVDVAVLDRGHREDREAVTHYSSRRDVEHEHGEPIDRRRPDILDRIDGAPMSLRGMPEHLNNVLAGMPS